MTYSFDIAGGKFRADMPNSDEEPLCWTVTFVKDDVVMHTATIPMSHPPVFGPDVEDVLALNIEVENLIEEWGLE